MANACEFCGSIGSLTREHVFGQWVSQIGLDLSPVMHRAGALNGMPRDMGEQPPFRQTVKSFCASCNNGWMSQLEMTAQRVLTPLILGRPGTIAIGDQAAIALWAQKTALTAMLLSSQEQRDAGYGLSTAEYHALYDQRGLMQPPPASRFWIGRFEGRPSFCAIRVTPVAVRVRGMPEPETPQAYTLTLVLGQLLIQGLRFTTPALEIDVGTSLRMPTLWPSQQAISWPEGQSCSDQSFLRLADGKLFESGIEGLELRAWTPATELPQSSIEDGTVQVPALCRKHFFRYPVELLLEAMEGKFYVFETGCECGTGYLIEMEQDGAHCKAAGEIQEVSDIYENLPGDEFLLTSPIGDFVCKLVPAPRTPDMP